MSERYSKLFALPENLYANGSPAVIAAGALLKDNQTGKVLAQLKLRNIGKKSIKAAKVYIRPLDTVGNPLGEEIEYQYLDLSAERNAEFGAKSPIALPDAATRSFSASVVEVIFADNTLWKTAETLWEPLTAPAELEKTLRDRELVREYCLKFGADCRYHPEVQKDLWYCACGALNRSEETVCHRCKKSMSSLLNVDMEALKKARDARIAAAQQKAAEEKAAAEVKAKKTKKMAMIIAPIVVVLIVVAVLISNIVKKNQEEAARLETYNAAIAMVEAGRYDEAIAIFSDLGDYKDSVQQIANTKKAKEEALLAAAYAEAENLLKQGAYAEACAAFEALGDYKDSTERLKESLYYQAMWLLEQDEDAAAYESFLAAGDYGEAKEQLAKFQKILLVRDYTYGDNYGYETYYEYMNDGKLAKEFAENNYTTEYMYGSEGVLIQTKRLNYLHLVNGNPVYYLTDFDKNGSPVRIEYFEDDVQKYIWDFTYEYAEDGSILSLTCTYKKQYCAPITEALDFTAYGEKFYADTSSTAGTLYLNAYQNDETYVRYVISVNDSKITIEESSFRQMDSNGNLLRSTQKNVIGVEYTYSYENTYDEQGNLIQVLQTSDKSDDIFTYDYIYGFVYCPDTE